MHSCMGILHSMPMRYFYGVNKSHIWKYCFNVTILVQNNELCNIGPTPKIYIVVTLDNLTNPGVSMYT